MTINEVMKNLVGIEVTDDFLNDVICAFEDFEVEGETEVILSKDESNGNIDYQAYINHKDSPIICIKVEDGKIKDAWEA